MPKIFNRSAVRAIHPSEILIVSPLLINKDILNA